VIENSAIALLGAFAGLFICSIPMHMVLFLIFRPPTSTDVRFNRFAESLELVSFSVGMALGVFIVCGASALDHKIFPSDHIRRQTP
jgi:hypothetical protein